MVKDFTAEGNYLKVIIIAWLKVCNVFKYLNYIYVV